MTLIQELKNPQARDTLAHAMFNIVKKPTGMALPMLASFLVRSCFQACLLAESNTATYTFYKN